MNYRRLAGVLIATGLVLAMAGAASAEGLLDKNLHYFAPPVDNSGLIVSYGSEPLGMFRMTYGVYGDVAMDVLDYAAPPDAEEATLISTQAAAQLVYGIGFWKYVNVGFGLSYIPYRQFDDAFFDEEYPHPDAELNPDLPGTNLSDDEGLGDPTEETGLEDIRLDLKLIGIDRQERCIGVALVTTIGYPLGYKPNQFLSDGGATIAPRLIVDFGRTWYTLVFNGGYKYYAEKSRVRLPDYSQEVDTPTNGDLETNDEIMLGGGAKFRFAYGSEIILDSQFRTQATDAFGDDRVDYGEVMAAYRKYFRGLNYTALTIGGGVGVLDGIGSPLGRFFIGITRDEKRFYIAGQ